MRVYIKANKMAFIIPLPNVLLKLGVSFIRTPFVQKYVPEKNKKYIDIINFKELSNCIDILKEYKGLKIVDVQSKDGNHVTITL